jgi:two-component system alkaline phosphatase synthesis response regulator PhoP
MIYYVEDDENIRELVVYTFKETGLQAKGFSDSTQLYPAIEQEKPDLIMLDIMLPHEDGITILSKLKSHYSTADIPVIMVSAKDSEYDKVSGLDKGADDYITKPFGMTELVARVKALLRRNAARETPKVLRAGGITLDSEKHTATLNGEPLNLTLKEYDLLACLMAKPGIVFTRDQLLSQVWDYSYDGGTRTVDVHVQTLRAKLKEEGKRIETVRGVGYRFEGEEDDQKDL